MSTLSRALDKLKFDMRMEEWNYQEGLLTKAEYQNYLNSLEDMAHRAVALTLEDDVPNSDTH